MSFDNLKTNGTKILKTNGTKIDRTNGTKTLGRNGTKHPHPFVVSLSNHFWGILLTGR